MGQSLHALLSDDNKYDTTTTATQDKNLEQTELDASRLYLNAEEVAKRELESGREDDAREHSGVLHP